MSLQNQLGQENHKAHQKTRRGLWKDVRRWLPGVLISLIAIIAVAKFAGSWQDVAAAFGKIRLIHIAAVCVLTLAFLLVRAQAWKILLGGKATSSQTFWVINQGYLLNNIFPLRAGEIARAIFMGRIAGLNPFYVLSTIVIERAFDLAMAAGLLLSTLPLVLGAEWAKQAAAITMLLVVAGFVVLYLMARFPERVEILAVKLGGRWGLVQKFVLPQLNNLLKGLSVLSKPAQFLKAVFWIVLSWGIAVLCYYILLLSIAPSAPFWWGVFADAMLAAGIAVPSAPGAIGVFEGTIVFALSLLGVQESLSLAYGLTLHALQIVITGILGLIGLARQGRSLSKISRDLSMENVEINPGPGVNH